MNGRECSRCLEFKDYSHFYFNEKRQQYHSHCKGCRAAYARLERKLFPERNREAKRRYRARGGVH